MNARSQGTTYHPLRTLCRCYQAVLSLSAGDNSASVRQLVLGRLPLRPHSLEVLRQGYLMEKVLCDHFALEYLAERIQEKALRKARLQSHVGVGYDL